MPDSTGDPCGQGSCCYCCCSCLVLPFLTTKKGCLTTQQNKTNSDVVFIVVDWLLVVACIPGLRGVAPEPSSVDIYDRSQCTGRPANIQFRIGTYTIPTTYTDLACNFIASNYCSCPDKLVLKFHCSHISFPYYFCPL